MKTKNLFINLKQPMMKKLLLFVSFAIFGFSNISAQDSSQTTNSGEGFNLGLHLGIL